MGWSSPSESGDRSKRASLLTLICCLLMACLFGGISYSAILTKGPTYDEPEHFGAGYAHVFLHDDRMDCEHPVLWKVWPMLAIPRGALTVRPADPLWIDAGYWGVPIHWSETALFAQDHQHGMDMINRARFMMMLLGVIWCMMTAWWAWLLAGRWAAIAAVVLISLDPTCLAHSSLIKNDVPLGLITLLAIIAMWRAGRRLTVANALSLIIATAVAFTIKFSALLLLLTVFVGLIVRACVPEPWPILGRMAGSFWKRLIVAPVILLLILAALIPVSWAAYDWHYAPSSNPRLTFGNSEPVVSDAMDQIVHWLDQHHVLPHAMCIGFIRQHAGVQSGMNYLLGTVRSAGWWYYYPFAFIVKTPLCTLLAIVLACIATVKLRRGDGAQDQTHRRLWNAVALALPIAVFLAAGMTSDYDHGLRSLLPIFPMIYICVAVAFARSLQAWPRVSKIIGILIACGLAAESLSAYPNFIPFFNIAAGGSRGGLALLGDSNLDWGQDLPLLVNWQHAHPNDTLYLAYYGGVQPIHFHLRYKRLPGYYRGVPDIAPQERCVMAISATLLQGNYIRKPWDQMYAEIRTWKPREVLGGSIYLYDFPPPEMASHP